MQTLKQCLATISQKDSITATIEGKFLDIIYVGELEIHTVLTRHCALIVCGPARCLFFSIWPLL